MNGGSNRSNNQPIKKDNEVVWTLGTRIGGLTSVPKQNMHMLRMFVVALHIYNHYYMYIHVILLACCLHNMFVSRCLLYMSFSCITLFNLCSLSCVDHIKDPYTFGGLFNSCFEIIQDKDHTPVLACWLYSGFGCCIMRFLLRCVFT